MKEELVTIRSIHLPYCIKRHNNYVQCMNSECKVYKNCGFRKEHLIDDNSGAEQ